MQYTESNASANYRCCPCCGTENRLDRNEDRITSDAFWDHYNEDKGKAAAYFVRCCSCGLSYQPIFLSEPDLIKVYEDSRYDNSWEQEDAIIHKTNLHYIDLCLGVTKAKTTVLDIGCDNGSFLNVCRGHFKRLVGVDPNKMSTSLARAELPEAQIITGTLQDVPKCSFDLVTIIHVLDHISEPIEFLKETCGYFADDTVGLIVVHNEASLLSRLLGTRFPPRNPQHPQLFSPKTMKLALRKAGFSVVRQGRSMNYYPLKYFVRFNPFLPPQITQWLMRLTSFIPFTDIPIPISLGNMYFLISRENKA